MTKSFVALAFVGMLGCSGSSSGGGDSGLPPADATADAPTGTEGGHDGGPSDATTGDGSAPDASDAHTDGPAADGPASDGPAGDGSPSDSEVSGGATGDGGTSDGSLSDGATGDAAADGGAFGGDGGFIPSSALCTSACPGGETSCMNGCGPVDWRLTCSSACHPTGLPTPTACKLANAVSDCAGVGACEVAQCAPGHADCDHDPSNGCEADLESPASCGACGTTCAAGQVCSPGGCVTSCSPPLTQCTDRCVNLAQDPAHCGGCSTACTASAGAFPTCTGGSCGVACATGYTACSGTACSDLQNDPGSCGTCGKSCPVPTDGRASCVAGNCQSTCQPGWTLVGTACQSPATTPTFLTTGLSAPEDIAVDGTRVYWTDTTSGTVNSMPLAGGSVTPIATGQAKPLRIAVDDAQVYWSNNLGGAVMHAPKDGSGTAAVLASAIQPTAVAVLGGYVHWANDGQDVNGLMTVQRVPVAGGTPSIVSTTHASDELLSDGFRIVFAALSTGFGTLYEVIDAGGGLSSLDNLSPDPSRVWLGMDGGRYYVMMGTNILGLPVIDKATLAQTDAIPLQGTIQTGGIPNVVRTTPGTGDGCALYYLSANGIEMLVHGTSWPALIVPSTTVHRIATSAGFVYWTDTTGAIGRVAVP